MVIGAVKSPAELAFGKGDHASTFGAGPIPCSAAVATLAVIEEDDLLANAREQGERIRTKIRSLGGSLVAEVRGAGLLVGIQLAAPVAHDVVLAMIDEGVLATEAGRDVVRLSPPLVVQPPDIEVAVGALGVALARVAAGAGVRT